MAIRAVCAVPLGFGLPSPLHDSMQDISLQERRLYALVVSGFTGQRVYLFCASERLGPVCRGCRLLRQAQSNHAAWYPDQFVTTRKPSVICRVSAGWTTGLLDLYSRPTRIRSAWIGK